jgi:hypothetical protein
VSKKNKKCLESLKCCNKSPRMILIPISGRVGGLLRFYENHSRRKSFNEFKKVNENVLETQKFWIFQRADSVFFFNFTADLDV